MGTDTEFCRSAVQIEGQTRCLARAAGPLISRTRPRAGPVVGAGCGAQIWGQTRCPIYRSGTSNVQRSTLNFQWGDPKGAGLSEYGDRHGVFTESCRSAVQIEGQTRYLPGRPDFWPSGPIQEPVGRSRLEAALGSDLTRKCQRNEVSWSWSDKAVTGKAAATRRFPFGANRRLLCGCRKLTGFDGSPPARGWMELHETRGGPVAQGEQVVWSEVSSFDERIRGGCEDVPRWNCKHV